MTTSGVETADLIEPWLYARLAGDDQLTDFVDARIYGSFVPDEVNDRYVMFQLMSAVDVLTHNADRVMVNCVYLVKAVAMSTSKDDVAPAFGRVDALLRKVDVDTDDGHISCHREVIVDYPEVIEGQVFLHLGGQYRIRATRSL